LLTHFIAGDVGRAQYFLQNLKEQWMGGGLRYGFFYIEFDDGEYG